LAAALSIGVLALWSAPVWAPLRDPHAQPDTPLLRNLPPLATKLEVTGRGGKTHWADSIRENSDGSVTVFRPGETYVVPAEEISFSEERFWLGTDEFGRDVLSRLVHGARISLLVGLMAASMALFLGSCLGLIAGLGRPWLDGTIMRATDVVLAIPKMFLLLLLVSIRGSTPVLAVVAIGTTTWMATARVVRAGVLGLHRTGFVESARAGGAGPVRLAVRHILPSLFPTLAAEAALRVGQAILLESSLSFLGLVVPPPAPTWGNMIAEGRYRLHDAWWIATFPGVAIALSVLAVHALAESARRRGAIRSEGNA
jgi:peptide/nickel transport system permease protein